MNRPVSAKANSEDTSANPEGLPSSVMNLMPASSVTGTFTRLAIVRTSSLPLCLSHVIEFAIANPRASTSPTDDAPAKGVLLPYSSVEVPGRNLPMYGSPVPLSLSKPCLFCIAFRTVHSPTTALTSLPLWTSRHAAADCRKSVDHRRCLSNSEVRRRRPPPQLLGLRSQPPADQRERHQQTKILDLPTRESQSEG